MKKIKILLFIIFLANSLWAQDVITRSDSTRVSAVIIEINPNEVKYKLANYADGPTIIYTKAEIAYIVFRNGAVERFSKREIKPNSVPYDPNRYNMDATPVKPYNPIEKAKTINKLYAKKNYVGFNYIAFLNACFGFNYMRDVKKANLIINVPFAVGMGRPIITNQLYGRQFLDGTNTTKYEMMKYQVGINALFAPSMNSYVNFLMGPALNITEYEMSVETRYTTRNATQYQANDGIFNNNFKMKRQHYGINIGFLARFSERVNMNMLITFGYKKDLYSKKDPYGIAQMNMDAKYQIAPTDNVMPYVNFAWSVGYRF